ncbi:hypothetical protein [Sinorhizobium fredii]|uniref:hypothetical protein n=1 Tax=Rhizobium fredii TaxID=380 RepID=UPI0035187CAC
MKPKRRLPAKRVKMIKAEEKPERKQKKRVISSEFQRKFRQEQAKHGRKAVTLWLDPEIHSFIEQIKEEEGFQNLRETTYHFVKASAEPAKQGRKAVTLWLDPEVLALIEKVKEQEGFQDLSETTYHFVKVGLKKRGDGDK